MKIIYRIEDSAGSRMDRMQFEQLIKSRYENNPVYINGVPLPYTEWFNQTQNFSQTYNILTEGSLTKMPFNL